MKLYNRIEHFGIILYNPRTGEYNELSHEQALRLMSELSDGRGGDLLRSVFQGDPIPAGISLATICNDRVEPTVLSAPLKAFFNITKRCNLHCAHCYNDSGRPDSPELPLQDILSTLKELLRRGVFKVTLAGGEPLWHSQIGRILDYAAQTDLSLSLITNGVAVSEVLARTLAAMPNMRSITVSLDGADADSNDPVRGHGAFERTLEGVALLRRHYNGKLAIRTTLTALCAPTIDRLPALVRSLGVREMKVNRANPYGRAANRADLVLDAEEHEQARKRLLDAAALAGVQVEIPSYKYQIGRDGTLGLCKAGHETFEIDGDGNVYPCSFSTGRFCAGNVATDDFKAIFRNLQRHTINNEYCYSCRGRGGTSEKPAGYVPHLVRIAVDNNYAQERSTCTI